MALTRLAVKFAVPLPKAESFERYLFIGPHPDDIEVGCGATVAALKAMGKSITFLVVTDGRYGDSNSGGIRGDELAALRKKEALTSAKVLGIDDVRFMELSDGGFYTREELEEGIARVIGEVQPEILFAPDPCVNSECHADHLNVGEAVRRLANFASNNGVMEHYGAKSAAVKAVAFYMTARPNVYIKTSGYIKLQDQAIFDCHTSQYPEGSSEASSIRLYIKLRSLEFGIRSRKGKAEGFRLLDLTRMHCLPEAGL